MKALSYFAIASKQVAQHAVEVDKIEATLNSNAVAGLYFQVHDSNQVPAEGAVPLKSWPAGEVGYKEFKNEGGLALAVGLYVCLSTTAATKTLSVSGGNDKVDILSVELMRPENPIGTTFVGDTTTAVTSRAIWSEAAGAARKKLLSLEVDATGLTANAFVQIFAKDAPADGGVPMLSLPIADNQVKTGASAFKFGAGLDVIQNIAGVLKYGCTVVISSTAATLTTIVAQTCTIKGEYL